MDAELQNQIDKLSSEISRLYPALRLDEKQAAMTQLETLTQTPNFWADSEKAAWTTKTLSNLQNFLRFWPNIKQQLEELAQLNRDNTDESPDTMQYLRGMYDQLMAEFSAHKLEALFTGKYDQGDAVLAIHAGAGGTDAQDFALMLLRMYLRFGEKKSLQMEVIEKSAGNEAGIKSAIVEVKGACAYGLLKSESGVHRLVRLSPFNSGHTRETSFALVEVLPVLEQEENLKINPADLEIEAKTASGHGGQSVNTTYSAIRITHKPTGIKVSIQNERSQHQNKELALKILTARLLALKENELHKEKTALRGEYKSAEWGNQIRSYVLHPYQLVKDHRTGQETAAAQKVLDGDISQFIESYLEATATNR